VKKKHVENGTARHTLLILPLLFGYLPGARLFVASAMRLGFGHMALGLGMGLSSETRFDFGHISVLGGLFWTLGKAFPGQECSHGKQSRKAVRRAGKDVKGFDIRREPMRML